MKSVGWFLGILLAVAPLGAQCLPDSETLCFQNGRFSARLTANSHLGRHEGQAVASSHQDGAFYLFDERNLEILVKVIDGRGYNGAYWVFFGSLTSLDFELTLIDTETSIQKVYRQNTGHPISEYDVSAFPDGERPELRSNKQFVLPVATPPSAGSICVPSATRLCLGDGRIQIEALWRGIDGLGVESPVPARLLADHSGAFWFFDPTNPEVALKIVDGRGFNRAFWLFTAPMTSLPYDLVVTDTGSGRVKVYPHDGQSTRGRIDLQAFVESQSPPAPPLITEPAIESGVIGAFDVRLQTAPMSDPDPGDDHYCTGFEVWSVEAEPAEPSERVWTAPCLTGPKRTHADLRDGQWEGSRERYGFLEFFKPYRLRARHRDSTGYWGPWAERQFSTAHILHIFPMVRNEVSPSPTWTDKNASVIDLPLEGPPSELVLKTAGGSMLYQWKASESPGNLEIPGVRLEHPEPLRLVIVNRSTTSVLRLPQSEIHLGGADGSGNSGEIFLPTIEVEPGSEEHLWIAENGSTFFGRDTESSPIFETMLRHTPRPWAVRQAGFRAELVASDLKLPVKLAFPLEPGALDSDVLLYATELYGTIMLVRRDGTTEVFLDGLLDFDPIGTFPGAGEIGLTGLVVDPVDGDLLVSLVYPLDPGPSPTQFSGRVQRLGVDEEGRFNGQVHTVLDMAPDLMTSAHQISDLSFGPDGKLYVHQGDGYQPERAHDLHSFLGKILRLNRSGTAPADNPFYDPTDGIDAADYVFAYGFRNPFGGDWSESLQELFTVGNGLLVDRLARIHAGASYGWDSDQNGMGTDEDMRQGATYNWESPPHAPAGLAFVQPSVFGGSDFPETAQHVAFVTEYGQGFVEGILQNGKKISAFRFDENGQVSEGPTPWVEYTGYGRTSVVAIAAGPDGLYFAEFFDDSPDSQNPTARGARLWRLRWVGDSTP